MYGGGGDTRRPAETVKLEDEAPAEAEGDARELGEEDEEKARKEASVWWSIEWLQ